jgi:methyl-accepting chemotaxis protein
MKNLKVWQKLVVMGVVFLISFVAVTYRMISIDNAQIEQARQEILGLEYCPAFLTLLKDLQQHRGMSNAWLSGDASFKDKLVQKRADIEKDIKAVDEVNQRLDGVEHTGKKWSVLRDGCLNLLNKPSLSATESFQRHTEVIGELIALLTDVGDSSNLALDADLDSYYLMTIVIFQGPELSEALAQARGLGSGMIASKTMTPEQIEKLIRLSTLVDYLRQKVDESMHKALKANSVLEHQLDEQIHASSNAAQEAGTYIRSLASRKMDMSAEDYFSTITKSIDQVFVLETGATEALHGVLSQRVDKYEGEIFYVLLLVALGLLGVCLVSFFIIHDITSTLNQVVGVANQIAEGDLAVQSIAKSRKDEIGVLAQAFDRMGRTLKGMVGVAEQIASGNLAVSVKPQSERDTMGNAFAAMIEKLSRLVGQVQKSGIQVNASVTEIAATAKQQQATASEIAATTTEVSATSKEISATSKELVKTMSQVSAAAEQSATLASSGQAGLSRMEETMRQVMEAASSINAKLAVLNEKASNINQVVTTITKVADQTNLLSLNAAIEAEKAGEYGRGFAVVATEIRRLADQTAVATYDIEQMVKEIQSAVSAGVMGMDKFSEEVRRGMQEIQQIGGQLSQIIHEVQAQAPRFETVNEGMQAQATGAEQINQALMQLSEAVQQTVESLRQSNQAIEGLNQASTGLRNSVSRFKLEE